MDAKQEAKLGMFRTVQALCNQNPNIIQTNVAFFENAGLIGTIIKNIVETASLESEAIGGVSVDKSVSKKTLCTSAYMHTTLVNAFAAKTNNNTLKGITNYSISGLLKLKDQSLVPACQAIYKAAFNNLDALGAYGVTTDTLAEFKSHIDNYHLEVPKPRAAQSVKSTYSDNLKALFKEGDHIIKGQLDKLVINFQVKYPDFVSAYKKARVIMAPSTTPTQIKGTITNALSGLPVSKANIAIQGGTIASVFTSDKGRFNIKPVLAGVYSVIVTAAGYKDYVMDSITAKMGQITKLEIGLTV